MFLDDFNGDDYSDVLCVSETGSRTLAMGDAAGTMLVCAHLIMICKFALTSLNRNRLFLL